MLRHEKAQIAWLEKIKWMEVLFSGVSGIFSFILFTRENLWLAVFVLAILLMAGLVCLLFRKGKPVGPGDGKSGDSPQGSKIEGEKREYFLQVTIRKLAFAFLIVPPITDLTFFFLYCGKEYCCCEGKLRVSQGHCN